MRTAIFGGAIASPTRIGSLFIQDSFTGSSGSSLQTHVADSGGTWSKHASYGAGDMQISDQNRAKFNGGAVSMAYHHPTDPTNADYDVTATLRLFTDISVSLGVSGRIDTASQTFYCFNAAAGGSDLWRLTKVIAGVTTHMQSVATTWTPGTDYVMKLEMRGSAIKGYVDGVLVCSATNSEITAKGKSGLFAFGTSLNSAGMHLDSYEARNAP